LRASAALSRPTERSVHAQGEGVAFVGRARGGGARACGRPLHDGSVRAFKTASMNIGELVEPKCHVTENFGKVRKRTAAIDRVIGAWRPGRK
jgi:hypothetical protein